MAEEIRVDSTPTLRIGPFVDVTDANTADAPANIKTADYAVALKEGTSIAVNIRWDTWTATNLATHYLDYSATNAVTNQVGQLDIMVADADTFLPVHNRFMVVNSRYYDLKYCGNAANVMLLDAAITTVNTAVGVANHRLLDMAISQVNTAIGVANHRLLDLAISAANASMGTANFKLLDLAITAHNASIGTANFRLLDGAVTTVNSAVGAVNVGVNQVNAALGAVNHKFLDLPITSANSSMGTVNFRLLDLPITSVNAGVGAVNVGINLINTAIGVANTRFLDVPLSTVNTTAGAKDTQIGLINTGVYQTNALVDGIGIIRGAEAGPIPFFMTNVSDHISAMTGRTVWVSISKDGTAFSNVANTVAEISDGWYKVWLSPTDTVCNYMAVRAVNANCDTRDFTIKLES